MAQLRRPTVVLPPAPKHYDQREQNEFRRVLMNALAESVTFRSSDFSAAEPRITLVWATNSYYPNDGGGSFDINFAVDNMPAGATYDLDYEITYGNYTPPATGSASAVSSGDTISHPLADLPEGDLVIRASLAGVVIATGTASGAVFT